MLPIVINCSNSRLLFGEVCPENSLEIPEKSADFSANLSLKIARNLTFSSATYQKPCLIEAPRPALY